MYHQVVVSTGGGAVIRPINWCVFFSISDSVIRNPDHFGNQCVCLDLYSGSTCIKVLAFGLMFP